jgi:hypothetical protein
MEKPTSSGRASGPAPAKGRRASDFVWPPPEEDLDDWQVVPLFAPRPSPLPEPVLVPTETAAVAIAADGADAAEPAAPASPAAAQAIVPLTTPTLAPPTIGPGRTIATATVAQTRVDVEGVDLEGVESEGRDAEGVAIQGRSHSTAIRPASDAERVDTLTHGTIASHPDAEARAESGLSARSPHPDARSVDTTDIDTTDTTDTRPNIEAETAVLARPAIESRETETVLLDRASVEDIEDITSQFAQPAQPPRPVPLAQPAPSALPAVSAQPTMSAPDATSTPLARAAGSAFARSLPATPLPSTAPAATTAPHVSPATSEQRLDENTALADTLTFTRPAAIVSTPARDIARPDDVPPPTPQQKTTSPDEATTPPRPATAPATTVEDEPTAALTMTLPEGAAAKRPEAAATPGDAPSPSRADARAEDVPTAKLATPPMPLSDALAKAHERPPLRDVLAQPRSADSQHADDSAARHAGAAPLAPPPIGNALATDRARDPEGARLRRELAQPRIADRQHADEGAARHAGPATQAGYVATANVTPAMVVANTAVIRHAASVTPAGDGSGCGETSSVVDDAGVQARVGTLLDDVLAAVEPADVLRAPSVDLPRTLGGSDETARRRAAVDAAMVSSRGARRGGGVGRLMVAAVVILATGASAYVATWYFMPRSLDGVARAITGGAASRTSSGAGAGTARGRTGAGGNAANAGTTTSGRSAVSSAGGASGAQDDDPRLGRLQSSEPHGATSAPATGGSGALAGTDSSTPASSSVPPGTSSAPTSASTDRSPDAFENAGRQPAASSVAPAVSGAAAGSAYNAGSAYRTADVTSTAALALAPAAGVPPVPGETSLEVRSLPSGAKVIFAGHERGVTPLVITGLVPGRHDVMIEGPFPRVLRRVDVAAGSRALLIVSSGDRAISAPNSQATAPQPQTPTRAATQRLLAETSSAPQPSATSAQTPGGGPAAGPRAATPIAGSRPGAPTATDTSAAAGLGSSPAPKPAAPATATATPSAPAPTMGRLVVQSPLALDIIANGRRIGNSGDGSLPLAPGSHELELINESVGYREVTTVHLSAGQRLVLPVEVPQSTLTVEASPGTHVWVDGREVGEVSRTQLALPIGPHEVLFRHPDFGERRVTALVKVGLSARAAVDFKVTQP